MKEEKKRPFLPLGERLDGRTQSKEQGGIQLGGNGVYELSEGKGTWR